VGVDRQVPPTIRLPEGYADQRLAGVDLSCPGGVDPLRGWESNWEYRSFATGPWVTFSRFMSRAMNRDNGYSFVQWRPTSPQGPTRMISRSRRA
jgi:hypothetical protein